MTNRLSPYSKPLVMLVLTYQKFLSKCVYTISFQKINSNGIEKLFLQLYHYSASGCHMAEMLNRPVEPEPVNTGVGKVFRLSLGA